MGIARPNGYSAQVDLYLLIDGIQYPVAKVGGNRLYLDQGVELPECVDDVILVVKIDGQKREHPIVIHRQVPAERLVQYF